jgi:hypothetical protein
MLNSILATLMSIGTNEINKYSLTEPKFYAIPAKQK